MLYLIIYGKLGKKQDSIQPDTSESKRPSVTVEITLGHVKECIASLKLNDTERGENIEGGDRN